MEGEALCVGDQVCLYSEDVLGYIVSFQSSCIHNELAVVSRQEREKPQVPNCQAIAFEICVANRYKLTKAYQKLKAKSDADPDDLILKTQCLQAEIGADAENEDNVCEQRRQLGKKVVYGQVIQLKHMFTGKFIHVSTSQTSRTEPSNIQVALEKKNAKHAQFCIMPRYKVKSEGDQVQVGDQVILESIKSPGQYLHVSKVLFDERSVYSLSHELNLSMGQSGFTIYRRYKPEPQATEMLKAGVPLRLFHKEIEAYLCAEGLFHDEVTEDVHLRLRPMDHNSNRHMFPSTSGIVYWELELESSAISGSVLRWGQQCRFRHMTTRHYLCVDANQNVRLTKDHHDANAVFRLHPVVKQSDEIEFETYCRIEHVVTNTWLQALPDEYKRKQVSKDGDGDMSMAALQWTQAPLRQIGVSTEMRYDDAFTIQRVTEKHVETFNYVAGMVPFLQKLIADKKGGMILKAKQTNEIVQALQELHSFLIVYDVPNKERQKLLRNLRVVELLVKLLQIPYRGCADQRHIVTLLVKCYEVLYTYLMGNSRKNELYIAKYIDFFNTQISYQGDIGLNAAKMVMQLVKDNRKIVDRITHKHIDDFVDLLRQNKNYCYLDLLSVLCVCDGVSISDNQTYITQAWLMEGHKNCVYHTELGEKIRRTPGVVFVSTDNRHHWVSLHEFVRDVRKGGESETDIEWMFSRDHDTDEEYLFLTHQLDLFGNLCAGRNSFAIQVITEDLCYLTIEEAFLCLKDELLPDELRSVYCALITGMAVDVGDATSIVDAINLTFIYDKINEADCFTARPTIKTDSQRGVQLLDYIAQLREWLSQFLAANMDMTASDIGHNMLLEQVLHLIYCLVKFGHYGNMNDMKQLLDPLLSLLNGRNDKPYPYEAGVPELQSVQDHYRTMLRFKQSPETNAIVDAKCQAMVVLDLFCNFQFNTRLEGFMQLFRVTYAKAHHSTEFVPELGTLLNASYDINKQTSTNKVALKRLAQLFQESDYFGSFPLTDILLDLSDYDYDAMVVKPLALLNRQYSAHESLFKYAVQAQVSPCIG
ncbi:hypothetical protein NP493_187g03055 [Ridgeia piscesae]|uniref:Inositol 1,4,5-trisphosphate receptor n=1 Tax=Ridgeia piscesae TaxID=27915 RepID=A0AAD9P2D2_RIDPI|nr:hypothetical protein NP493_187g03055 [Ridgeia piscesae]